jgi:hypothetical protein
MKNNTKQATRYWIIGTTVTVVECAVIALSPIERVIPFKFNPADECRALAVCLRRER